MVKKKVSGQEEPVHNKHNEQFENKKHSHSGNNSDTEKSENPKADDNETQNGGNSAAEVTSSDKLFNGERSTEEKLAEMQDKYIRLSAEFDNYRKRTLREKMELSKYANESLLLKILPVMDDFERAIAHMDSATDCSAMKNGIDLIYLKFTEFLKQTGLKEVESMNCDFNVDLHDAVAKVPVMEEEKKGKIVDVIQKGYFLQDKVIRHSKVVIGE